MELLRTKAGEMYHEADGPPTIFAVGCYNGEVYLIRFGPDDTYYDVHKEAKRLQLEWAKANRLAKRRERG